VAVQATSAAALPLCSDGASTGVAVLGETVSAVAEEDSKCDEAEDDTPLYNQVRGTSVITPQRIQLAPGGWLVAGLFTPPSSLSLQALSHILTMQYVSAASLSEKLGGASPRTCAPASSSVLWRKNSVAPKVTPCHRGACV